jgi:hypothetical protein
MSKIANALRKHILPLKKCTFHKKFKKMTSLIYMQTNKKCSDTGFSTLDLSINTVYKYRTYSGATFILMMAIVPDRRRRNPEVVLVRRWVTWVLGIWRGEGLGKGLRKGRSVYKQPETEVDGSCHS